MRAAVSSRLLAACSVRAERSWLPLAISLLAVLMLSAAATQVLTMSPGTVGRMLSTSAISTPISSFRLEWNGWLRSPWVTVVTAAVNSARGWDTLRRIRIKMPSPSTTVAMPSKPQKAYMVAQCVAIASSSETCATTHQPPDRVSRFTSQGWPFSPGSSISASFTNTSGEPRKAANRAPAFGYTSRTFLPASVGCTTKTASCVVADADRSPPSPACQRTGFRPPFFAGMPGNR